MAELEAGSRLVLWPWVLALILLIFSAGAVMAADRVDGADASLTRLEMKFFQHDYGKDTVDSRLDRLEKMVFGEAKTGSEAQRLANLVSAVPNLNAKVADEDEDAAETDIDRGGSQPAKTQTSQKRPAAKSQPDSDYIPPASSKYPAVTAIETRIFGKDFAADSINSRLDRLESKVFGKPSGIDDMSERVDRLKQRTGIDLARMAPPGSDWADEDEDAGPGMDLSPPVASSGEDGKSFSGRDLRKDMQQSFGRRSGSGSAYGNSYPPSGTYGMDGNTPLAPPLAQNSLPRTAPPRAAMPPDMTAGPGGYGSAQPSAMGLNQQVAALETEIFGKTYVRDPLPARLNRLESTVFPQEKPAADKALPERVTRLLSVIPLSRQPNSGRSIAQGQRSRSVDPDFADFDDLGNTPQAAPPQAAPPRASSGLSKIINSIGNFLTGGFVGGYPMNSGNMITDPQTGLWYDTVTGNLVDPVTGVVVGQRGTAGMMPGMGFGSFSNGFAPFGSMPYGIGSGTGVRFGFGGIGRYGMGGMWP